MKAFLVGLLYDESGKPSLTRVLILLGAFWALFILSSDKFITWGGQIVQTAKDILQLIIGAKVTEKVATFITNSVYNSPKGEAPSQIQNKGA